MKYNEKVIDILNDLLKINNDRIEGYNKASEETNESDLKSLFRTMGNDSRQIASELTTRIASLGGEPVVGDTTGSGKIYRVWMDVKATFAGNDRESVLNSCEFGEDAAQKAYNTALDDNDLTGEARTLVQDQQLRLKRGHDTIKAKRDMAHAAS